MKKYIIYSIFIIIWFYNYKIAFSELDKFNDSFEINNTQPTTSSSSSWWGWYSWTQYQKDNPKEIEKWNRHIELVASHYFLQHPSFKQSKNIIERWISWNNKFFKIGQLFHFKFI